MIRSISVLVAILVVLALPFAFKPKENLLEAADETLVVISPHNEAIRYEFARAFSEHIEAKHGKKVRIDWRIPGGTSEIARFIFGEYKAAFENYWTRALDQPWTAEIEESFQDSKLELPEDPSQDSPEQAARRAFLASDVSCGIDIFFGGGRYEYAKQAAAGHLVNSGILRRHPNWFGEPTGIPQVVGGEEYWDPDGRWIGACVSAFGIVYNSDSLARLGVETPPTQWQDLGKPVYQREIALADPTKSGSAAAAFEMLIQQQMQLAVKEAGGVVDERRLAEGWAQAMRLIRRIAANTRYFTDSASKIPLDVSQGNAAAGMAIDFYGRFQSEAVTRADGSTRLHYVTPVGGTSIGADPIAMLRGAPNPELAQEFIDFVMSIDGQKLWNFKVGTPGGPVKYALRRLPIVPALYAPEYTPYRSDPDVNPYQQAEAFEYHPEWTGRLFTAISFTVRVMCLDPHQELKAAWEALVRNGFPPQATARFDEVAPFDYQNVQTTIAEAVRGDRIRQVKLARELSRQVRAQYQEVVELAERGE